MKNFKKKRSRDFGAVVKFTVDFSLLLCNKTVNGDLVTITMKKNAATAMNSTGIEAKTTVFGK